MANSLYAIQDQKMKRLSRMTEMISQGATGTPGDFAKSLGIGKTRLRELINVLIQAGLDVRYNRDEETYYFEGRAKYELQCRFVERSRTYGS
ncbi:MAG: hypothetical protein WBA74_07420 [Cyclobacteriaceae bacterium]